MPKNHDLVRAVALAVLACFLNTILLPIAALGQEAPCSYDRAHPTLSSARINFKSLNYHCAELEIQDFLKLSTLSLEDRANAHVLMAAVYYAQLKDDKEKKERVIEQFKAAFKSFREWRGDLDISSTEFIDMMKEAQILVDEEAQKSPVPAEQPKDTVKKTVAPPPAQEAQATGAKKAWYKNWWAIALGVGVVAAVAVAVAGGGSSSGEGQAADLPNFPPPPQGK